LTTVIQDELKLQKYTREKNICKYAQENLVTNSEVGCQSGSSFAKF